MSALAVTGARPLTISVTRLADRLLLGSIVVVTWHKIHWAPGGSDVTIEDIASFAFLAAFAGYRIKRRDAGLPRVALVLLLAFLLLEVTMLAGFFSLQSDEAVTQYAKGMTKYALHFAFLIAACAHVCEHGERLLRRVGAAFVAGLALNAGYGVLQLVLRVGAGINLDRAVIGPLTFGQGSVGGINVFGQVSGQTANGGIGTSGVYRVNALALDPNHLGIMLIVPLMLLTPLALAHGLRERQGRVLWALLAGFAVVQLLTLSRSAFLGDACALAVLAWPLRRELLRPRFVLPVVGGLAAIALLVATSPYVAEVFRSRFTLSDRSAQSHFEFFSLVQPVLDQHPFFGLGWNTFSVYYEFLTGKTNWGPHSYFIALLVETGIVGATAFAGFLAWLFLRLEVLRRAGRALARRGEGSDTYLIAVGLTAALVGTMAANVFYLTMSFPYFSTLVLLIVAASAIASGRARGGRSRA